MKKLFLLTILLSMTFIVKGQTLLSLDSCRALALANNKDLLISNEKINAAHYERKAAFTNYLPNFSATGTYMRNQKEFSLLNKDQKAALSGLGTNLAGPIQQAATQIATLPMQQGDVYQTYADTSRLEQEVGYKPKISLHEGIGRFIEWYKSEKNPLK